MAGLTKAQQQLPSMLEVGCMPGDSSIFAERRACRDQRFFLHLGHISLRGAVMSVPGLWCTPTESSVLMAKYPLAQDSVSAGEFTHYAAGSDCWGVLLNEKQLCFGGGV